MHTPVQYSMRHGTLTIALSCMLFGGVYFLTPYMAPLESFEVWAFRVLFTVPVTAVALVVLRQFHLVSDMWDRVRRRPTLLLGVLASGLLLSLQLWLFGWAPLNGRALSVALGYFLLPLVLVVVGRFLYRDELKWWHWLAAGIAAIGVTFEVVTAGTIGWEPFVVCLGYPLYFMLRRALGTANTAGMLWELIVVLPFALWLIAAEFGGGTAFTTAPHLWWFVPMFCALAAVALWLYILSSRLLPMSIFGLLTYLEPALLSLAAILIGERILTSEVILYGAIWTAVLVLLTGGIVDLARSRGQRER